MYEKIRNRTWVEIDLDAIKNNYKQIKYLTDSKLCCVIKANAYGHGSVELAKMYEKLGADYFAVSNIEEAVQLRNNKIVTPILILGYTPPDCADFLSLYNISQCVYSLEYAEKLNSYGVEVKVHIKIDTGMGRIGFKLSELDDAFDACKLENLKTEGIFTHFAVADEPLNDNNYTHEQFRKFEKAIQYLKNKGVKFDIRHCANSATICNYPDYHLDMVRAGLILYGLKPSEYIYNLDKFKPVMTLKSVISHVKKLHSGEHLGYGRTYLAVTERKVATIPIGYADGFWRNNGNQKYSVLINGHCALIVGRVCMDQIMVDVTNIDCKCGDQVIIFGDFENCNVDILAKVNRTINYEIACAIGERVPRAYVENGKITKWKDNLIQWL